MLRYPVTSSLITYWSLAIDKVGSAVAAAQGMAFTQYRALRLLAEAPSGMTTSALADELVLSRAQARRAIVALVDRGLAAFPQNESPYAAPSAATDKGHAVLDRCNATAASAMMDFMLPAKETFDAVTLKSRTWIRAGLDQSGRFASGSAQKGLDIGDVIRLGLEGAAKMDDLLRRRYRRQNISKLEYRILLALEENGGVLTAGALADELLCALPNVSNALKSLSMREFVRLQKSPRDRRVVIADLSDKGFGFCRAVTQTIDDFLMSLDTADSPEVRRQYIEISKTCVNAERERRAAQKALRRQ